MTQTEALRDKLQENRRRLNLAHLQSRLNSFGVSGSLNQPEDIERLAALRADPGKTYEVYSGWSSLRPVVEAFAMRLKGPVILAPLSFEELGSSRLTGGSLPAQFFENPLEFDIDGFWVADQNDARLIDFDGDHLEADVWFWRPSEGDQ